MKLTASDLIERHNKATRTPSPTKKKNQLKIKEIYKQPMILCRSCKGHLAYKSFIKCITQKVSILRKMSCFFVHELSTEDPTFLALTCPICDYSLGIKYVSKKKVQ